MTKIVNFCNLNSKEEQKELKPIELVFLIDDRSISTNDSFYKDCNFFNYTSLVLSKEVSKYPYDLIMCWGHPSKKLLYWGHWNDGVV